MTSPWVLGWGFLKVGFSCGVLHKNPHSYTCVRTHTNTHTHTNRHTHTCCSPGITPCLVSHTVPVPAARTAWIKWCFLFMEGLHSISVNITFYVCPLLLNQSCHFYGEAGFGRGPVVGRGRLLIHHQRCPPLVWRHTHAFTGILI